MQATFKDRKIHAVLLKTLNSNADAKLGLRKGDSPRSVLRPKAEFALKRKEVVAEIGRILKEDLNWNQPLRPDFRLVEDLQLDSLALLTLAAGLENRFSIHLLEGDPIEIGTVDDLARHVLQLIRHREGGEKRP
jgi:acyl carrier protein